MSFFLFFSLFIMPPVITSGFFLTAQRMMMRVDRTRTLNLVEKRKKKKLSWIELMTSKKVGYTIFNNRTKSTCMREKGFDFICCSRLHHERICDKRDKKALYKKKKRNVSIFVCIWDERRYLIHLFERSTSSRFTLFLEWNLY